MLPNNIRTHTHTTGLSAIYRFGAKPLSRIRIIVCRQRSVRHDSQFCLPSELVNWRRWCSIMIAGDVAFLGQINCASLHWNCIHWSHIGILLAGVVNDTRASKADGARVQLHRARVSTAPERSVHVRNVYKTLCPGMAHVWFCIRFAPPRIWVVCFFVYASVEGDDRVRTRSQFDAMRNSVTLTVLLRFACAFEAADCGASRYIVHHCAIHTGTQIHADRLRTGIWVSRSSTYMASIVLPLATTERAYSFQLTDRHAGAFANGVKVTIKLRQTRPDARCSWAYIIFIVGETFAVIAFIQR